MDPKAQVRQAIDNAIRRQEVQAEAAPPTQNNSVPRPTPADLHFDERDYLELHQDVAEFVRKGVITAEEHWRGQGSKEGRQGRKPLTQWMAEVEAAHADAEDATSLIGREPPAPATLRGAVGAAVLKVVRPFFAWYTHGLREYVKRAQARETLIVRMLRSLARESRILEAVQSDLKQEVSSAATEVAALRSQVQLVKTAQARQRDVIDQQSLRLGELEAAQIQLQSGVLGRDTAESAEKRAEMDAALARLTGAVDRLNALHAAAEETRKHVESLTAKVAALTASVREVSYEKVLADAGQRVEEKLRSELTERLEQQDRRLWEVSGVVHSTRHQVVTNDARIAMLVRELRRMAGNGKRAPEAASLPPAGFETIYAPFEDVFRGTREEIKARQRHYVPVFSEAGAGTAEMAILDLGCGRGEWLELLREHEMSARGIDANAEMVERSREIGLDVLQADAIEYLRGLPDNSQGAITTFHLVEHLPFDDVLILLSESLRVLKTNGVFLLETPNPNNLFVGARNFYADPTHRNPLPCGLMRFVVEASGFSDVVVREVNPMPDSLKLPDSPHPCVQFINDNFFGPQDYAIIARKY